VKAALVGVGTALAASACCIGPVGLSLIGAGALGASAIRLAPYRPWFIGLTIALVAVALYGAYRPTSSPEHCEGGVCPPQSKRAVRGIVWIAAAVAAVLIAFPYYIGWFL
jgi:mercuric ion transport protein